MPTVGEARLQELSTQAAKKIIEDLPVITEALLDIAKSLAVLASREDANGGG